MSSEAFLVALFSTVVICLVRAHRRGRTLLGWGPFALFLWLVALLATWFVGPKKRITEPASKPDPSPPTTRASGTPARPRALATTPTTPVVVPAPTRVAPKLDTMIIDVTGPEVPLRFPIVGSETRPVPPATPVSSSYTATEYGYDMPKLGQRYRKKTRVNGPANGLAQQVLATAQCVHCH
jgi:energy-coupling factor transporter transmembrane protein EcfT